MIADHEAAADYDGGGGSEWLEQAKPWTNPAYLADVRQTIAGQLGALDAAYGRYGPDFKAAVRLALIESAVAGLERGGLAPASDAAAEMVEALLIAAGRLAAASGLREWAAEEGLGRYLPSRRPGYGPAAGGSEDP